MEITCVKHEAIYDISMQTQQQFLDVFAQFFTATTTALQRGESEWHIKMLAVCSSNSNSKHCGMPHKRLTLIGIHPLEVVIKDESCVTILMDLLTACKQQKQRLHKILKIHTQQCLLPNKHKSSIVFKQRTTKINT
jgi:hypothetical protein